MMYFGSGHVGFSFFGFLGFIVIVLYFLIMLYNIKIRKHSFLFSRIIFSVYFILLLWLSVLFRTNITAANMAWYQPFLLCIIVEGTIYLIKKYRSNKQ